MSLEQIVKKLKTKKLRYVYGFVAVFCVLLGFHLFVNHFTSGDEPHYLIMDYSIVHDKDLDLKNNYQNRDYYRYYPEDIQPHVSPLNTGDENSGWYSFHGVALPLFMVPFFLISEKLGPMILMTLIATSVIILVYIWTLLVTKNNKISIAVSGLLLGSYFFNGLSGYLYPDLAIAALTIGAFIILNKYYTNPKYQFIFGLILGLMVLFHFKTLLLAFPLGLIMWFKLWRSGKRMPLLFFSGVFPLLIIFFATLYSWFGVLNPSKIYLSSVNITTSLLDTVPAILFDANRGMLVFNPIFALIFVGLPIWFFYQRKSFVLLGALLPTIIISASFNEWWGGYSPSGRYFMTFVPVLMPAIGLVLMRSKKLWQQVFVGALVVLTLLITIVATLIKLPYAVGTNRSELFIHLQSWLGISLDRLLPTYSLSSVPIDRFGFLEAYIGMLCVIALVAYGYYISRPTSTSNTGRKDAKK